eukprot:gene863-1355_t
MPRDRDNKEREMKTNEDEEIRTVYISGLPSGDLHERELKNLTRFLSGYEDSMMNRSNKGSQNTVLGFVRFETAEDAQTAIKILDGLVYDDFEPEKTLRASLSKRNFESRPGAARRMRDPPRQEPIRQETTMMARPSTNFLTQPYFQMQDPYLFSENMLLQPFAQPEMQAMDRGRPLYDDRDDYRKKRRTSDYPDIQRSGGGGGCDTLCIQGLVRDSTEREVIDVYSRFQGYRCVNFVKKEGKAPVAFIRFDKTYDAERAMNDTQDIRMEGGAQIRVDFAKRSLEAKVPNLDAT